MRERNISIDELRNIAYEHISYEIEMFVLSAKKLMNGNLNQYENNSCLETLVIHARCLLDFLYPPNDAQPDNVFADDFFDDPSIFRRALPKTLPVSDYLKYRTGKEIAHLTYKRLNITAPQKQWNVTEVHNQIRDSLAIFFKHLSEEQRGWFKFIVYT